MFALPKPWGRDPARSNSSSSSRSSPIPGSGVGVQHPPDWVILKLIQHATRIRLRGGSRLRCVRTHLVSAVQRTEAGSARQASRRGARGRRRVVVSGQKVCDVRTPTIRHGLRQRFALTQVHQSTKTGSRDGHRHARAGCRSAAIKMPSATRSSTRCSSPTSCARRRRSGPVKGGWTSRPGHARTRAEHRRR